MSSENLNTSHFDQQDELHDVALEVEGRRFWIPRQLLANFSPVFKAMFYGDFSEAKKDVIPLPEKKATDIEQLLLVLVPTPELKDIDFENVEIILQLADEYQIVDLRRRSIKLLIELANQWTQTDPRLLEILVIASKYRVIEVLMIIVKKSAIGFQLATLQSKFDELRPEVVAALALYKNTISTDGKCKFDVSHNIYYCSSHRTNYFLECVNCNAQQCMQCYTASYTQWTNSKCGMTRISEVDEIVRKLFNSM